MEILDIWVESGYITLQQRGDIQALIIDEKEASYFLGYDEGYDNCLESSYQEGYEAALTEHGLP